MTNLALFAGMEGGVVDAYLVNGEVLSGKLVDVDRYDVFLHRKGKTVLISKHAVAWMGRGRAIDRS